MKTRKHVRQIVVGILCLALIGCASLSLERIQDNGIYTALELAGVLTRLLTLDYAENMSGLEQIETQYDVSLVEPTTAFFDAAKEELIALKSLREAMFDSTSRSMSPASAEIEDFINTLDSLIQRYDVERESEHLTLAQEER